MTGDRLEDGVPVLTPARTRWASTRASRRLQDAVSAADPATKAKVTAGSQKWEPWVEA